MTATVQRDLNTGDANCDRILTAGMNFKACFSYLASPNLVSFTQHNHIGMGTLQLGTDQMGSFWQTTMPYEFCPTMTCATSKQTIPSGTCALYDANPTAYPMLYTKACATGYDCTPQTKASYTCTISTNPLFTMVRYPGDKCGSTLTGSCVANTACTGGVCVGAAIGAACASSAECAVGAYCAAKVCATQLAIGATGCTMDTDCVNTAGCDITTTGSTCVKTMSLAAGTAVGECGANGGMNPLCMSGTCGTITAGSFCTTTLKSNGSLPVKCYMDGTHDCISTADTSKTTTTLQGMCQCTQSTNPKLYCPLQPGDSPNQKAMGYQMSWLASTAINKCHTMARYLPSYCSDALWSDSKTVDYYYWALYAMYYPQLQGSSSCVYNTMHWDYALFKKNHDSGAELLAVSAFVIALFA